MAYTHLALEEWYHIYSLSVQGFGPTAIAAEVGRNKSTVSHELRRNRGRRGYRANNSSSTRISRGSTPVSRRGPTLGLATRRAGDSAGGLTQEQPVDHPDPRTCSGVPQ